MIGRNGSLSTIRFVNTGYSIAIRTSDLRNGWAKDKLLPKCDGVGYLGRNYDYILKNYKQSFIQSLWFRWRNMISRCYDSRYHDWHIYGGAGVRVSERWHDFSNYFMDVMKLDGFSEEKFMQKIITLDKDKLQQGVPSHEKIYSKDTCCWMTQKEQCAYIDCSAAQDKVKHKFIVTFPDGHEEIHLGIKKFGREFNLWPSGIGGCLDNIYKQYKGFKFRYID